MDLAGLNYSRLLNKQSFVTFYTDKVIHENIKSIKVLPEILMHISLLSTEIFVNVQHVFFNASYVFPTLIYYYLYLKSINNFPYFYTDKVTHKKYL